MFIEVHILQNFAPSNLNRDDTNSPKDCEFGGYPRARISSQAIKRAIRRTFEDADLVAAEHRALRTKRLAEQLLRRFTDAGKDVEAAVAVLDAAVQGLGLKFENADDPAAERRTQYLLFLGQRELDALARVCLDHWDDLVAVAPAAPSGTSGAGRAAKRAARASVPREVQDALKRVLN